MIDATRIVAFVYDNGYVVISLIHTPHLHFVKPIKTLLLLTVSRYL